MENIIFSANVILPLLILMATGYLAKHLKLISPPTTLQMNSLVFQIFLPILLFNNVRSCESIEMINLNVFLFVFIGVLLTFIIVTVVIMAIEKDASKCGVMIQGIARSNYALFGIPLITMLFPNEDLALASLLVALVIPSFNIYSVVILTVFGSKSINVKNILLGIIKNPLIIGTALGIVVFVTGFTFPEFLDTSFNNLGSISTPLALFLLGAGFEFNQVKSVKKQLILVCLGRLVVIPAVILLIAVAMGFTGVELACIMIVFSAPTAVSSYTMAQKMGGNSELASAIVVFTSSFAIISIFVLVYVLKMLNLI